jgi:hypothetical protein
LESALQLVETHSTARMKELENQTQELIQRYKEERDSMEHQLTAANSQLDFMNQLKSKVFLSLYDN